MKKKVLHSFHNDTADLCVDLFMRDDGTYGYEEYRRDYEEGGGWFPLNRYGEQVFHTLEETNLKIKLTVLWLSN